MLTGAKEIKIRPLAYLRVSRVNKSGLTIIEVLIAALILGVILTGLFLTLNTAEFSNTTASDKIDLQADVRRIINWVASDLRGAITWEAAGNNPSSNYIKFNLWSWDSVNNTWAMSNNYIEYDYDASGQTLTRRLVDQSGAIQQSWEFNNITEAPFYTTYTDAVKNFNIDDFRNNRKLIVVITGSRQIRGGSEITYTLKTELKIRNG